MSVYVCFGGRELVVGEKEKEIEAGAVLDVVGSAPLSRTGGHEQTAGTPDGILQSPKAQLSKRFLKESTPRSRRRSIVFSTFACCCCWFKFPCSLACVQTLKARGREGSSNAQRRHTSTGRFRFAAIGKKIEKDGARSQRGRRAVGSAELHKAANNDGYESVHRHIEKRKQNIDAGAAQQQQQQQ